MKTEKHIELVRLYESAAMAKTEAHQLVNDDEVIAGGIPKPGQWKVKVLVKRATLIPAASATDPTVVKLEAVAEGEEKDIDRWVQEYNNLHDGRGLSRRQEAIQFQETLKAAQQKAQQG